MQLVLALELRVNAAQVAATVRGEKSARIVRLLPVAKKRAEHARDALIPGQLTKSFGIGNADQLRCLGAVADVLAVAVEGEIGSGAIDELETALADVFPMIGRDALPYDAAGDGDELVVDVGDAQLIDLGAHLTHQLRAARVANIGLKLRHRLRRLKVANGWRSSRPHDMVAPAQTNFKPNCESGCNWLGR